MILARNKTNTIALGCPQHQTASQMVSKLRRTRTIPLTFAHWATYRPADLSKSLAPSPRLKRYAVQEADFVPKTTTITVFDHAPFETGLGAPPAPGNTDPLIYLSTAAKVGIETGAGVAALLVLGAVASLLSRRRKHNSQSEESSDQMGQDMAGGSDLPEVYWGQELHGHSEQEMPTRNHTLEMEGRSGPAQLHASARVELEGNPEWHRQADLKRSLEGEAIV